MSSMQNSSTASRTCSTREPSWAEDFIDLSEFCQPSTVPTRMEDSVDELIHSPVGSTVRPHGFDYGLDGNEGLDPSLEETLWYLPSPSNNIQEELCDPISDWLAATKEAINSSSSSNNDNRLPSSHTEISYDLTDTFQSPRLESVPNATPLYDRKSMAFCPDDSLTPPLQADTTFFHSSSDPVAVATAHADNHHHLHHPRHQQQQGGSPIATTLNDNLLLGECLESHTIARLLPPANTLFKGKQTSSPPQPPPPPLPSISTLASATSALISVTETTSPAAVTTKQSSQCGVTNSPFQQQQPPLPRQLPSHNQFLDGKTEVTGSGLSRVSVNANVSFPGSMQSSSITQSSVTNFSSANTSRENEPPSHQSSTSQSHIRRGARLKLEEMNSHQSAATITSSSCTIDAPEMLNPLVSKDNEFDLVSYVFEDNKHSISFDLSNLPSNSQDGEQVVAETNAAPSASPGPNIVAGALAVTIKTEPKDELLPSATSEEIGGGVELPPLPHQRRVKRKLLSVLAKDEEDTAFGSGSSSCGSISSANRLKRSRRFSNCSSEDLTQLESEKYRELRNKNNEASRRSRANRKSRQVEMRDHAYMLESENRRLKFKAEEMEKLVKRLRNCLMQLVLKRGC